MKFLIVIVAIVGVCILSVNATVGRPAPVYVGCYQDREKRVLDGAFECFADNTPKKCIEFCASKHFAFAGVQHGNQCFCGNTYATIGLTNSQDQCSHACPGDRHQKCGGTWALGVYSTGAAVAVGNPAERLLGCFNDAPSRALTGPSIWFHENSPKKCIEFCQHRGFAFAGVQFGSECFCGNSYSKYGAAGSPNKCDCDCSGDKSKKCGGFWALNVYSTANPRPNRYIGCFADKHERDLGGCSFALPLLNSPRICASKCRERGFAYAGLQAKGECWCGNGYGLYGKADESCCNLECPGDHSKKCGGIWHQNIYDAFACY